MSSTYAVHGRPASSNEAARVIPDPTHMREAIRIAEENARLGRGGPFGAVVVLDGTVIASGTNCVTCHNDPTAHAEIVAIRNACTALGTFQLTGCVVYASCEPCPMCMGALYWARPAAVFYAVTRAEAAAVGFDDALVWRELTLPAEQRMLPMAQFLADEAQAPFEAWRSAPSRIEY